MLATLSLVLAACGGSDDDEDDGDGGGDEIATETTDAGDDGDDGNDEGDDEGSAEDSRAALEKLAGAGEGAAAVATYTITSEGTESTWKIYSEGENSRAEFGSGDEGTVIVITTPEATYTCTESAGEGFCFEGEGQSGTNPFAGLFTQYGSYESIDNYLGLYGDGDVEESSEEIAGVDAQCYTATGDFTGDAGAVKWCFAENGVLLLSSYELDSGTFEMRATDFSDSVPDGSFEPPYDITEIPGLPQ
jgi:hypothetical protein